MLKTQTSAQTIARLRSAGLAACALLAGANLVAGISGGLARFGLPVPAAAMSSHGGVMVCAFFGTLITLERALALRHALGLLAPLAAGTGGLLMWAVPGQAAAEAMWFTAAAALLMLYVAAGLTRAWSLPLGVELAGTVCWIAGILAWAQGHRDSALLGWMAFLVLTIGGERRELMQMVRLGPLARISFGGTIGAILVAVACGNVAAAGTSIAPWVPTAIWWVACASLSGWLLRWDIAPRMWRRPGWIGHTAICLTVGYGWLLAGALLGLAALLRPGGATAVAPHAVLLGFVFAMVFGHAPIVLPALSGIRPQYSSWARVPIWLLTASLVLRLAGADAGNRALLAWAGAGHALAIALFALIMLLATLRGRR